MRIWRKKNLLFFEGILCLSSHEDLTNNYYFWLSLDQENCFKKVEDKKCSRDITSKS